MLRLRLASSLSTEGGKTAELSPAKPWDLDRPDFTHVAPVFSQLESGGGERSETMMKKMDGGTWQAGVLSLLFMAHLPLGEGSHRHEG